MKPLINELLIIILYIYLDFNKMFSDMQRYEINLHCSLLFLVQVHIFFTVNKYMFM